MAVPHDQTGGDHSLFVVTSELRVRREGVAGLTEAFRGRIGLVDDWPGFDRLEVWHDERDPQRFVMTSWWSGADEFRAYMQSNEHRRSHERIPGGLDRPRAVAVRRHRIVST